MVSVRGVFRNGAAQPEEAVEGYEGQPVLITFMDNVGLEPAAEDSSLERLIETYAVDTGIPDLAHEHDHYLHGRPKRDG